MGGAWLFSLLFTTALFLPFLLPDSLLSPLREGDGLLRRFAEIIQQQREGSGYATDLLRWVSVGLWGVNLLCCLLVLSPGVFAKGPVVLALLSVCITLNYASFLVLNNDFQESGGHVGYVTGLDYYVEHELDQEMPHFEGTEYTHRVDYPPKLLNYGMLINQPSISNFHSIRTSYLDDFLVATGFSFSELPYAKPPDQKDGAIRTLLGVKTYYNYDEAQYPGAPDGFVSAGTDGDVSVYENAYALPIGFAYTHYTTPYRTSVYQETTGQLMLNAVVLDARNLEEYRSWIPAIEPEDLLPWQEAAEQRALMGCYDVVMDSRGLRAKIDLDETRLVFFSVPYDKGWSATVNGAPAEVKRINLGFVGLVVEAGDAIEIDLSFLPRGLREGALASLIALIVWTLYVAMGSRRKRNPATK